MSLEASAWAWRLKLPPVKKLILLAYADFANDERCAWPSHKTVSELTGASRSTVIRTLRELERLGMLVVQQGDGRTNRVRLNLSYSQAVDKAKPNPDEGCHSDTPGGVTVTPRGCQPDTPGGVTVTRGGVTAMTRGGCHSYDTRSVINHQDPTLPDRLEAANGRELDALAHELGNERLPYETDERLRSRLALAVRSRSAERAAS